MGSKPRDRWSLRDAPDVAKIGRERSERNTNEDFVELNTVGYTLWVYQRWWLLRERFYLWSIYYLLWNLRTAAITQSAISSSRR